MSQSAPAVGLACCAGPLVEQFDGLLLDLDGVVYVGDHEVPGAVAALKHAVRLGKTLGYVTNNASRSAANVAEHISSLGLRCAAGDVVTSAQVAASWLAASFDVGSPILVVGGEGLHEAVREVGLDPVDAATGCPVAVVQGFGPDVGWRELAQASYALAAGVPWVATNLDLTVPTSEGPALGNGALVHALTSATGRSPNIVTGKPAAAVFDAAVERWQLRSPLVVGDRLDTDIAGARNSGLPSLLVLSGISSVGDLLVAAPAERPEYIGRDLAALHCSHPQPVALGDHTRVGGWQASVSGTRVVIGGAGDPLDAVRAAASAAWLATDSKVTFSIPELTDRLELLLRDYG